jgi:hypothetical protein
LTRNFLAWDSVIYEELQQNFWRPHVHVMWNKKTQASALFKSALAPQLHPNFNDNCHQFSAEAKVKEMKESTTMTNHDPRMNRLCSIVLVELPPNTASIRRSWYLKYLLWLIWLVEGCLCVFFEWVLLPCACACACFGLSVLKTL